MRAVRLLDERGERGQGYTVFSDSQTAIARVQHDRTGPAQAPSQGSDSDSRQPCIPEQYLTMRWTPAHKGTEGNGQADAAAKTAAEGKEERAEPSYLRGASLSHLTRKTTVARSKATTEWIRSHVGWRRRYRSPKGGKLRKALARTREELAGRFYQLLTGHGASAEHLRRVNQARRDFVGGEAVGSVSLDTTSLSGAGGGAQRSDGYGR